MMIFVQQNALAHINVPIEQSDSIIANKSNACLTHGRLVDSKDKTLEKEQ